MNLQQLPRPIEVPSEPDPAKFIDEETGEEDAEAYASAMRKYEKKKAEADFWKFYEIRDCFIPDDPEKEVFMAFDYSNLEMRLLAHFSKDEHLMETFIHDHDKFVCRV